MNEVLSRFTEIVSKALELIAVLLIAVGAIEATVHSLWFWTKRKSTQHIRREAWLNFARWILLGLEFTLAADIVRTAVAPTWDSIGQLAAIALIRTFLSYFLERDLESAFKAGIRDPKEKDVL
ncbi:hypothetical protein D3C87_145950 [compost metagenome]